jgi:hypothetical protein
MMLAAQRNLFTGSFNPLSLSPALWLSDTGSNAGQWDDLSGNGRHATQATAANQPAIVTGALNGRQVRRFDGSNDSLAIADRALLRNLAGATVFAVATPSSVADGERYVFSASSSNLTLNMFLFGTIANQFRYGGRRLAADAGDFTNFGTVTNNTPYIMTAIQNWQSATKSAFISNGNTNNDTSFQTSGNSENANSALDLAIGKVATSNTSYWNGNIAEVLVFPTALSTENRRRIEGYLSSKYNIAIP